MGYTQHVYSTSHAGCIKAYERNFEQVNGGERAARFSEYDEYQDDEYQDDEYQDDKYQDDKYQDDEYQDNEYEDSEEDNDDNDDGIEGMFSSFVCQNIFINKSIILGLRR